MASSAFGKYRLIAEIGHGGMADVFLAIARGPIGFNKLLVVKRLKASLAEDPDFITMLVDEARIASRLNHPNVVQTYEVGQVDGQYFLAMEYLDGQPLHRILHRTAARGGLPKAMQMRVLVDVLAGLHHAHELTDYDGTPLEIVHRDVTPHNIFITYEGQVKVVDFGIAKAVGRVADETRIGTVKGKITYMAPEQSKGNAVDRRADIFSVGVMLWEAVTGTRLWKGMQDVAILQKLWNADYPTSPRSVNPDVHPRLDAICSRALAPKVEARYATAAEFQTDLEQFLEETDQRVFPRELGKLVAEFFRDKRLETKAILENQFAELKSQSTGEFKPILIPAESVSGHTSSASGEVGWGNSWVSSAQNTPLLTTSGRTQTLTGQWSNTSSSPLRGMLPALLPTPSNSTPGAASSLTSAPIEKTGGSLSDRVFSDKKKAIRILGIVALSLMVLVGCFVWFTSVGGAIGAVNANRAHPKALPSDTPVRAAASNSTSLPRALNTATGELLVKLTLRASPPEARFSIEDGPLLPNPYTVKLPKERHQLQVHAEAPGYSAKTQKVSLSDDTNDIELDISLERQVPEPLKTKLPPSSNPLGSRPEGNKSAPKHKIDDSLPF